MGTTMHGMRELLATLDSLDERADDKFGGVLSKGALNIKTDWREGWATIQSERTHIPHLPRGIGYDTDHAVRAAIWSAEIGVSERNKQAGLAHLIEFGSVNNAPHPAGQHALDTEAPRFSAAVASAAEELLNE